MIPKPLKSFIYRLREFTDAGNVEWIEGGRDAYYCNHKSYDLHISYGYDENSDESVYHFMMKQKGKEAFFTVTNNEEDFMIMRNLYESISVQASGLDEIEDSFFE